MWSPTAYFARRLQIFIKKRGDMEKDSPELSKPAGLAGSTGNSFVGSKVHAGEVADRVVVLGVAEVIAAAREIAGCQHHHTGTPDRGTIIQKNVKEALAGQVRPERSPFGFREDLGPASIMRGRRSKTAVAVHFSPDRVR